MAPPSAEQLFLRLPKYRVVICRQCQYAVRPNGIIKHLAHSNHRISASDAHRVEEAVQAWEDVEIDVQQLQLPRVVPRRIKGLAVYTDGLLCTVTPDCEYVCRSKESIRKHWRTAHNWSPHPYGGGVRQADLEIAKESIGLAMERVTC